MAVNIVGLATSLSNAPKQIATLLSGSFLNAALQLGDFAFKSFEIPERIEYGASQRLVVHKLLGNKRVVDALGRDDKEITWSGTFLGANALKRFEQLEVIRDAAQPVDLDWGDVHRHVMVQDLTPTYREQGRIDYSIVCVVVPQDDTDVDDTGLDADDPSIFDQLSDAVSDISDTIDDVTDQIQSYIEPVTQALGSIQSIVQPIASSLGVTIPCIGVLSAGLPGVMALASTASSRGATSSDYAGLDAALASQQYAAANAVASSTTAVDQINTNVSASTQPAYMSGIVRNPQDLQSALVASGAQYSAVTANSAVTLSRQQLVLDGRVAAAAFPSLQVATNDLVAPTQTIETPYDAAFYAESMAGVSSQQQATLGSP